MLNKIKNILIPLIVWVIYKVLYFTWKIEIIEPPSMKEALSKKKPIILSHWHGDELALIHVIPRYRIATMVSTSKDGEMMNFFIRLLGGTTSRGSSTRGGVSALKGLIRLMHSGYNTSMAVDGPKGPIYKVKPGVFELSKITQSPIYWAGVYVDKKLTFRKSWNQAILPKPFAKIYIHWFGPMECVAKTADPKSTELSTILENNLNAAKHQLSKNFEVNNTKC